MGYCMGRQSGQDSCVPVYMMITTVTSLRRREVLAVQACKATMHMHLCVISLLS